ncbi:hypothetical protein llap_14681 [Limosa lapponica baueri]|uniref:RRM domain-containing protein n=1 Tax=Limosa lapponica baueri TaxID=1758121 RepID=A0A2I0TMP1_LIMLA|nr:hypothetical protein llap_14681 [Limosa lapponica baueri]
MMVTRTKKIFVGGLSANTVVEDVKQYFEQFGKPGIYKSSSFHFAKTDIPGCWNLRRKTGKNYLGEARRFNRTSTKLWN